MVQKEVQMSHALFQSYVIPQGAPVRVCCHRGFLHKHKLKHAQQFNDDDRVFASMIDLSFRDGPTGVIGVAELESKGFIVFKTGREKWPYIVAGGVAHR